jgi:hypothetical protein
MNIVHHHSQVRRFGVSRGWMHVVVGIATAAALCYAMLLSTGAGGGVALGASGTQDGPTPGATVRIGTYDSRAVATAYVRSSGFAQRIKALQEQRAAAVKSGDAKAVERLENQGKLMQVRIHLQGFSDAPIDDVLHAVRDQLSEVARRNSVMAIVHAADYHDPQVELVDVTDDLVNLFNPDRETLKMVNQLRKTKPAAIEEIAMMPAEK